MVAAGRQPSAEDVIGARRVATRDDAWVRCEPNQREVTGCGRLPEMPIHFRAVYELRCRQFPSRSRLRGHRRVPIVELRFGHQRGEQARGLRPCQLNEFRLHRRIRRQHRMAHETFEDLPDVLGLGLLPELATRLHQDAPRWMGFDRFVRRRLGHRLTSRINRQPHDYLQRRDERVHIMPAEDRGGTLSGS